jgi:hypothetical protein
LKFEYAIANAASFNALVHRKHTAINLPCMNSEGDCDDRVSATVFMLLLRCSDSSYYTGTDDFDLEWFDDLPSIEFFTFT